MLDIPKRLLLNDPKKLFVYPLVRRISKHTQLKYAGLCQMYDLINLVDKNGVNGDIVEMGCGRGGCGALMAHTVEKNGSDRKVWLFDSFEGISEPSEEKDFHGSNKEPWKIKKGYLKVSQEEVEKALKSIGLKDRSIVNIVPGWFNDSLPLVDNQIKQISILRLDADLYEPTLLCLEALYDKVTVGGYVVIDDYKNWVGARKALYDFFKKKDIAPMIEIYPFGGVAFFKKS